MTETASGFQPRGRRVGLLLAAVVLVGSFYCYLRYTSPAAPTGQPALVSLSADNFQVFKDRFNSGSDRARVLVMLSPT